MNAIESILSVTMPGTLAPNRYFPLMLQITGRAWYHLGLDDLLTKDFPANEHYQLQLVAERMRERLPNPTVGAGQLGLLGLRKEVFRCLVQGFLDAPGSTPVNGEKLITGTALQAFVGLYPPLPVLQGESPAAYLQGDHGPTNRQLALIELFVLATQPDNRAAASLAELYDDRELQQCCGYRELLTDLDDRLPGMPASARRQGSLLARLREPLIAAPESLAGQLEYVQQHWGDLIAPALLARIPLALDLFAEETRQRQAGPGPSRVLTFAPNLDGIHPEPEAFSQDSDWMSNVVLIAKAVFVWLDQLSRRYGREIQRIDQIPDEELAQLSATGINTLWLIGLWERCSASQKIKQVRGNPEAMASAYALYDYRITPELGGEKALHMLRERCWAYGIRLGGDVVPNHTGLYSRWVKDHPDWYIQLDHPPYLNYRFTGPDLSSDPDLGLFLEDGYYDHSDAAVVFKHIDRRTGRVRYLYHGNDGTHLPWNDTAQLNYLNPEVREAMIRTIIGIARRFPVIRFDAAMTLAKKHCQRLWYPQPGGGAGVPSRAAHAMSQADFDRAFPVEFWREVVDRVAVEAPDTLLIAEAFWLMEGYFVRTLGMHRVYNTAFMNMLKREENAKYRQVIKNVLEFNPEILKRLVNFMNNPDEATAEEQFGKGDKYFGVAVLLATMPGLPMFGHGQLEGLNEKYGMEYRQARRDEKVDQGFFGQHRAQIFPLLRRRHLFSGADDFQLFDFYCAGHVNEDAFAYSNRCGEERTLVVYHNRDAETDGWLCETAAKRDDEEGPLGRTTLSRALGLKDEPSLYYRFRDHRDNRWYLRQGRELAKEGLYVQLGPYAYHVFLDFAEIIDRDGCWQHLWQTLNGRPVANLDLELAKLRYTTWRRA